VNATSQIPGNYSYLTSINSNDLSYPVTSLMVTIEVRSVPLLANFHATPLTGSPPLLVNFYDDSQSDAASTWANINSYKWDFQNDGVFDAFDQNPEFMYSLPGVYSVRLVVGTNTGLSATKIRTNYISVVNHAPVVDGVFTEILDMLEDTVWGPGNISWVFIDPDEDALVYLAQSSEHLSATISGSDLSIMPALNWFGTETIVLKAVDPYGLFVENPVLVTVAPVNDAPVVNVPNDLYFIRNSVFTVDFGQYIEDPDNPDSQLSISIQEAQMDPVIQYAYTPINTPNVVGQLTVAFSSLFQVAVMQDFIITVSDSIGRLIGTDYFMVHVLEHFNPLISLAADYQFAGQTVNFSDATLGNPDHWLWTFGDGTTSTMQHPTHQYLLANNYDVSLTLGNSQVPSEDRQIVMSGLINLSGTAVTDVSVPNTWTPAGSPYNLFGDVVINNTSSVQIMPNVTVNLFGAAPLQIQGSLTATGVRFQPQTGNGTWGGLRFSGNNLREPSELQGCTLVDALNPIIIDGASPTLNNITITVSDTTNYSNGTGISVTGESGCAISNTEIINYKSGVLLDTDNTNRETPTLTNVRIRNTSSTLRTEGDSDTGITLKCTAILDSVEVENYVTGLNIDSSEDLTATSPTLTNVRIRNTSSALRIITTGMRITGNTAPELDNLEIENFVNGMIIEDVNPLLRDTPTLTNVRIRNTSSTLRSITHGLEIINTPRIDLEGVDVDSFYIGLKITADQRSESSPTLTNVRIRNTTSSLRQEGSGLIINGAVYPCITDLQIDDYTYGMTYQQDFYPRTESSATLTNVRIRNTSSTLRQLNTGAAFSGLSEFSLSDVIITDYGIGLKIVTSDAALVSSPSLSNLYIRNTSDRLRDENTAIYLGSGVTGSLKNSTIKEAFIGIFIADGNATVLEKNHIIDCQTGIKASGTNPLPISKQLFTLTDQFYSDHLNFELCALELIGSGPWNVYQNTFFNYPKGAKLSYANLNFHSNILWTQHFEMIPFVNNNSTINCSYSDIYSPAVPYPGTGNISQPPLFVAAETGDFHLTRNSPCIDAGNPAFTPDSDGSVADMGAFVYLHRASFIAAPHFVVVGSSVSFTNTSLGHDYPDTVVGWDIGSDGSIEGNSRDFNWIFNQAGVYNVKLLMQSGALTDSIIYPALIEVSSYALLAPQNPVLAVQGNNISFSWDPVTHSIGGEPVTVSLYMVFKAAEPYGFYNYCGFVNAPATNYTDIDATLPDKAFYIVLGFAGSREELNLYLLQNQRIDYRGKQIRNKAH